MQLFELFATLGLDSSGLKSGLKEAKTEVDNQADGAGSLGETAANLGAGIAKKLAAAFAAIGVGALIKKEITEALNVRGDYEQWTGAADAIFGDAAQQVVEAASSAAKVAGMSANEYLESVNEIGKILTNQGVDQSDAASYASQLVQSAADYAATYNVSMETALSYVKSVANGKQGALSKAGYDFSDDAITAYGESLGVVVDDTNRAIVATQYWLSLNESANGAFQNSLDTINNGQQALSAAWQTFLTTGEISQFLDVLLDNVVPTLLEQVPVIIEDLANGVVEAIPRIVAALPDIIATIIPAMFNGAAAIVQGLITNAPDIIASLASAVWELLKALIEGAITLIESIFQPIVDFFNGLLGGGRDAEFDAAQADYEAASFVLAWLDENDKDYDDASGEVTEAQIMNAINNIEGITADSYANIVAALQENDITVTVNLTNGAVSGSHAAGLLDVPYNGYVAQLHAGEMVLNKAQSDAYRNGSGSGSAPLVVSIDGKAFAAVTSRRTGKNIGNRQLSQLLAMGG